MGVCGRFWVFDGGSLVWWLVLGFGRPILALDGRLFLIIEFGFVCGYACRWDLILWVGEPIWVLGVAAAWVDGWGFWVKTG